MARGKSLTELRDQPVEPAPPVAPELQPPPALPEVKGKGANYYCLEASHARELISEARFFRYDHPVLDTVKDASGKTVKVLAQDCPVCDVCKDRNGEPKQVSAVPVDVDEQGRPVLPAGILALAERLG